MESMTRNVRDLDADIVRAARRTGRRFALRANRRSLISAMTVSELLMDVYPG